MSFVFGGAGVIPALFLFLQMGALTAAAACGAVALRFGRTAGLVVGILFAAFPVHVAACLSMDPTALLPLSLALGWWVGERAARSSGRQGIVLAACSGLLLGSAVTFRYEAGLILGFVFIVWAANSRRMGRARALAGTLGVGASLLYFPVCGLLNGSGMVFYNEQLETSALLHQGGALSVMESLATWLGYSVLPLGFFGIPLALIGLVCLRRSWSALFLVSGFLAFGLFLVKRSATTSLEPEGRYAYVLVALGTVLVGLGAQWFISWWSSRRAAAARTPTAVVLSLFLLGGSFGTLTMLPGRDGPAWEAGRLPLHIAPVQELMAVVQAEPQEGRILFLDSPSDLPFVDLLIHVRLQRQDEAQFIQDLRDPYQAEAIGCDSDCLDGVDLVIADHPMNAGLDQRLEDSGWRAVSVGRWDLRFRDPRGKTP